MNLKLPQLIALAVGGVLIYAAVKNVNAAEVIKAVLTGQPLPQGPVSSGNDTRDAIENGTATVNPDGTPNGGTLGSDGSYYPPDDSRLEQPHVPNEPKVTNTSYRSPVLTGTGHRTVSV